MLPSAGTPQLQKVVLQKATMSSPDPSHDSFAFDPYDDQWDPYDDSSQRQTQADELKLCQLPNWDSERTYDDDPPVYIHYSIEWKLQ